MARVAVLIPVHNDPDGLAATLASLGDEKEPHDIVVVDDGSSPPLAPGGFQYLIRLDRNLGITGALNAGLAWILAQNYCYVARLDAGDLHCPGRLSEQARTLDLNPNQVLVGGQAVFIHSDGRHAFDWRVPTHDSELRRKQHLRNCLIHPALMIKVQALRLVGQYRGDRPGAEDYDMAFRLMRAGVVSNLNTVVVRTRLNPAGVSSLGRRSQLGSMFRLQLEYFDWRLAESYLGLIWSCLRWIAPFGVTTRIKMLVRS